MMDDWLRCPVCGAQAEFTLTIDSTRRKIECTECEIHETVKV